MSEFSSSAATETSDMELVPTTASIAFVWSAAKPLPCQMLWAGHGPTPHRQRKVRSIRNTWLAMYSATPLPCASSPNETRSTGLSFGFRKRF